jgi:hypothetical protein
VRLHMRYPSCASCAGTACTTTWWARVPRNLSSPTSRPRATCLQPGVWRQSIRRSARTRPFPRAAGGLAADPLLSIPAIQHVHTSLSTRQITLAQAVACVPVRTPERTMTEAASAPCAPCCAFCPSAGRALPPHVATAVHPTTAASPPLTHRPRLSRALVCSSPPRHRRRRWRLLSPGLAWRAGRFYRLTQVSRWTWPQARGAGRPQVASLVFSVTVAIPVDVLPQEEATIRARRQASTSCWASHTRAPRCNAPVTSHLNYPKEQQQLPI